MMLCNKSLSVRPFKASRASTSCRAVLKTEPQQASAAARRAVLFGGLVSVVAGISAPAFALIPDEEDEDLVEKAKANRKTKLEAQKRTTQEFLKSEGLKDVKLDKDLIPVEKAILRLAEVGTKIEKGDTKGAASSLSSDWVGPFELSLVKIGGAGALLSKMGELKNTLGKGDATGSKRAYVDVVADLQTWSTAAGLSSELQGIN